MPREISSQSFKNYWAVPNAGTVHQPKQKTHFIVRVGGQADAPQCGTGMGMVDERTNRGCTQTDAYDTDTNGYVWYAKTVTKPKLSLEAVGGAEELNGKQEFFGGIGKAIVFNDIVWEPLKLTLVDPSYPNATRKLLRILRRSGFGDTDITLLNGSRSTGKFDIDTHLFVMGNVELYQYVTIPSTNVKTASNLYVSEKWTFYDCALTRIDFGELDYSSNDLLELQMEILFKYWDVQTYDIGDKQEIDWKYNKDIKQIFKGNEEQRKKEEEEVRRRQEQAGIGTGTGGTPPAPQQPSPPTPQQPSRTTPQPQPGNPNPPTPISPTPSVAPINPGTGVRPGLSRPGGR